MDEKQLRIPLKENTNILSSQNIVNKVLKTPTKSSKPLAEPITPTANLKLLTDLASKEIIINELGNEDENLQSHYLQRPVSRKEKSLGLLCVKFLQRYPEFPSQNVELEINLDEVSRDLRVERRRIYDIVNVLESVDIVRRCAKNLYVWLGKTKLKITLAKLKAIAEYEKIDNKVCSLKQTSSDTKVDDLDQNISLLETKSNFSLPSSDDDGVVSRKEKSLGMMSRKFLMLFLISKPQIVNLETAACILIGESSIDDKKSTTYKTKIRRLYDIANILTSLHLIEKVHVTELRGRKPAFQYIGPNIDDILIDMSTDAEKNEVAIESFHSLLGKRSLPSCSSRLKRPKFPRTKSENNVPTGCSMETRLGAKTLIRHPSLQDFREVVEEERRKLYSFAPPPSAVTRNKRLPTEETLTSPSTSRPTMCLVSENANSSTQENTSLVESSAEYHLPFIQLPLMIKIATPQMSNDVHSKREMSRNDVMRSSGELGNSGSSFKEENNINSRIPTNNSNSGLGPDVCNTNMNQNNVTAEMLKIQDFGFVKNVSINNLETIVCVSNVSTSVPSATTSSNSFEDQVTPLKTSVPSPSVAVEQNNCNVGRENLIQYIQSPMHLVLTPTQYTTLMNSLSSPSTSLPFSPLQCASSVNSPQMFLDLTEKVISPMNFGSLSSSMHEAKLSSAGQKDCDETAPKTSNKRAIVSRQLNMTR